MTKSIKNLPASIHNRLKNLAKTEAKPFQEIFTYYAIERFLYRLAISPYADKFALKRGLMFPGWGIKLRRPTRDIDFQGFVNNSIENIERIMKEICVIDYPDGIRFDPDSVKGEEIVQGAEYPGVRIYLRGYLATAFIQIAIDLSFANAIVPNIILIDYPSLLGMPAFKLCGYPVETAIAEKFEAMVSLGVINDRLKDFFDIWLLTEQMEINGETLVQAIKETFNTRNTEIPTETPVALTAEFAQSRQNDWVRFLPRSGLSEQEFPQFSEVTPKLAAFLLPAAQAAAQGQPFQQLWVPGGSWSETGTATKQTDSD